MVAETVTKVVISAVDQTQGAIASATKGVQSLSKTIASIPGFSGLAASLASVAGGAAIKSLIGDTVSWAASMADLSTKTGSSVDKLSGLAKVAKIGGLEIGDLEQGLVRLSKALAGSDDESRGAAHALASIGLSIDDLRAKDPADAFKDIADAIEKYGDGAGKTAAIMDILGKTGAQFLPTLRELAQQSSINGKLSDEQARAARELETAWMRVNAEGGAWAKSLALSLIPTLASLIDWIIDLKGALGGLLDKVTDVARGSSQVVKTAIDFAGNPIGSFYNWAKTGQTGGSNTLIGSLSDMAADAAKSAAGDRPRLRDKVDAILAGNRPVRPSLSYVSRVPKDKAGRASSSGSSRGSGSVRDYDDILTERVLRAIEQTDLVKAQELVATLAKLDQLAAAGLDPAIVKAVRDDLTGATKAAADEVKRLDDLLSRTPTAILEKERSDILFLVDALEKQKISEEQYLEAVSTRLGLESEAIRKNVDDLDQFAIEAARNIQDAFADFLFDPFKKGTESMAQSFGNAIRRMIANAVAADLGRRLFGDFGKTGSLGGWLGDAIGWATGESFASGIDYVPRDMHAQLHKGERVVTAADNAGFNRQPPPNISFVINMGGGSGAAELRRSAGEIGRQVVAAYQSSLRFA